MVLQAGVAPAVTGTDGSAGCTLETAEAKIDRARRRRMKDYTRVEILARKAGMYFLRQMFFFVGTLRF